MLRKGFRLRWCSQRITSSRGVQVAQALGRGLLKGSEVTYVTTAVELINATERGDPYIEILSHLDFQGIEFKLNGGDVKLNTTVPVGQNTRSIRVRFMIGVHRMCAECLKDAGCAYEL